MDPFGMQLYKEIGFAFICGENGMNKKIALINRLSNEFVANHKTECMPIINAHRDDKLAIVMGIEKLMKELDP